MQREEIIYGIFTLLLFFLVVSILIVPILAESHDMRGVYSAFSYTCHQKMSRSLCIFNDGEGRWIADCLPYTGEYVKTRLDHTITKVDTGDTIGYKMPVCSRDFGLYGALLLGALIYPVVRELKDKNMFPAIVLIAALVPIALDGGIQIISELGWLPFVYESANITRLITGGIAGFVASFFAIPVLMNMFGKTD